MAARPCGMPTGRSAARTCAPAAGIAPSPCPPRPLASGTNAGSSGIRASPSRMDAAAPCFRANARRSSASGGGSNAHRSGIRPSAARTDARRRRTDAAGRWSGASGRWSNAAGVGFKAAASRIDASAGGANAGSVGNRPGDSPRPRAQRRSCWKRQALTPMSWRANSWICCLANRCPHSQSADLRNSSTPPRTGRSRVLKSVNTAVSLRSRRARRQAPRAFQRRWLRHLAHQARRSTNAHCRRCPTMHRSGNGSSPRVVEAAFSRPGSTSRPFLRATRWASPATRQTRRGVHSGGGGSVRVARNTAPIRGG